MENVLAEREHTDAEHTDAEYTDAEFEAEIIDGEIEMLSVMIRELIQKRQELDLNLVKLQTVRERLLSTVAQNMSHGEQLELPFDVTLN